MQLQELKSIWDQYDQNIDRQIKIDFQSFKKISLEKTRSLLTHLKVGAIVEFFINLVFISPGIRFCTNHISELKFALPGMLLVLFMALTMAWNVYSVIFLSTFNYKASIAVAQKKLATFNFWNLNRQLQTLYIVLPLSWAAMLIVFGKAFLRIDMYQHPGYLVGNLLCSVLLVPPLIWFIKKFPDKKMNEALEFLNSIKRFEKE